MITNLAWFLKLRSNYGNVLLQFLYFPYFFCTQFLFYFVNWSIAIDLWFLFTVNQRLFLYSQVVQIQRFEILWNLHNMHISLKTFFDPTGILPNASKTLFCGCFLKLCPIFVGPTLSQFTKFSNFLEAHTFFFVKIKLILYFELKTPQPT